MLAVTLSISPEGHFLLCRSWRLSTDAVPAFAVSILPERVSFVSQKLATVRREAAAREATITEEAAVHRAEAEAAAQLVAAMRPKGDNVLATLWTKVRASPLYLDISCRCHHHTLHQQIRTLCFCRSTRN